MIKFQRLKLTPEKFVWLWDQIKKLEKRTLNDHISGPEVLWETLQKPDALHFEALNYQGETIGFLTLAGITDWAAVAHATFFDLRLRGREEAVRSLLRELVSDLGLQIVHAFIPESHRASIAWLKRIGFEYTGCIPMSFKRQGKLETQMIFAITPDKLERSYTHGISHRLETTTSAIPDPATITGSDGGPAYFGALLAESNAARTTTKLRRLLEWWAAYTTREPYEFARGTYVRSFWG